MSEDQKRQYDVQLFQKKLNRTKAHFQNFDEEVVPIVEALELEEESRITMQENQEKMDSMADTPLEQTKEKKSESSESSSDEKSGDEEEEGKEKKKAGKQGSDEEEEKKSGEGTDADEKDDKSKSDKPAEEEGEEEDDDEHDTQQQLNEREYIEFAPTEPEIVNM